MAEIKKLPLLRHLRAEPTSHVLAYRGGKLRTEGPGQSFWFRAINTAIAEVPIDDRELPFLFHVRSADFQALTVQGVGGVVLATEHAHAVAVHAVAVQCVQAGKRVGVRGVGFHAVGHHRTRCSRRAGARS